MDRQGPRSRPLILVVIIGVLALGAAAAEGPLRAQRWLAAGADKATALGSRPPECLRPPSDPELAYRVEVGRAAFRTPLLLGGQAARAGISCETCHKSGRSNPDFRFPGVSGAPGTADVTSSLFSSHRGDGVDNPRPIPDLGGPKSALKVSQAPEGRALEGFIHGLVTEEFDGAEPPAGVIEDLADYVRALSPDACPSAAPEPVRAAGYLDDARRAVRAAQAALARKDAQVALLMVGAARSELGLVYERYDGAALAADRAAIDRAGRRLAAAAAAIRARDPRADARLADWLGEAPGWSRGLLRDEPRSLFNPDRLKAL